MLSQRIIYLADDLRFPHALNRPQTKQDSKRTKDELKATIELFESSHNTLIADIAANPEQVLLYFGDPTGQGSLDHRVRKYIALARNIVADPAEQSANQNLERLYEIERAGLLQDLDHVVTATETASIDGLSKIRDLGRVSMLLGLVIIFVEIFCVFLPGHRFIRNNLSMLRQRNAQLDEARCVLDENIEDLATKNRQIAADKELIHDAWQESEALRKEQSEFTYAVSHDLKSPANTMHLLLNELKSEPSISTSKDADNLVSMAIQTVQRMEVQIEDVLQYCWTTDRRSPPTKIDLDEILQDVLDDLDYEISSTRAEITHDTLPGFFGYGTQIRVLLSHLIGNGIKFRSTESVPKIHIECVNCENDDVLTFTIQDNGIGISPDDHAKIFRMFQRLHVREAYAGSGLGLATCHRIARNHDGKISVASNKGVGSRFTVTLHPRNGPMVPHAHFPKLNAEDAA